VNPATSAQRSPVVSSGKTSARRSALAAAFRSDRADGGNTRARRSRRRRIPTQPNDQIPATTNVASPSNQRPSTKAVTTSHSKTARPKSTGIRGTW